MANKTTLQSSTQYVTITCSCLFNNAQNCIYLILLVSYYSIPLYLIYISILFSLLKCSYKCIQWYPRATKNNCQVCRDLTFKQWAISKYKTISLGLCHLLFMRCYFVEQTTRYITTQRCYGLTLFARIPKHM